MRLSAMVVPLALVVSSCDARVPVSERPVVRDSAGVRIVENLAPAWSDSEAWTIGATPLFRILGADGSDRNVLVDPTSIDVDATGRIIVADGNMAGWHAILVYDQEGNLLFRAGRKGEGPGEFGQLWWASAYRGDSIVGFDQSNDRVTVFDPSGRFVRQVSTPQLPWQPMVRGMMGFTAGIDAAYDDGSFLAYPHGYPDFPDGPGPGWTWHALLRLAPSGERWDTLGTFKIMKYEWDGEQQRQLGFTPYPFHALFGQSLYYGLGESFEVRRFGPEGELEMVLRKHQTRRPVTNELREQLIEWFAQQMSHSVRATPAMIERVRRQFEDNPWADSLPAFSNGFVDALGYLWVEHYRWMGVARAPVPAPAVWSLFDSTGVWLGDLKAPEGLIIRAATEDRVYGFVVDSFDVKEIEVYELTRR